MEEKIKLHVEILLRRSAIAKFKRKIREKDYNSMAEFFREIVREVLNA